MSDKLTIHSMLPANFSNIAPGKTFIGIDFGTSTTVVSIATFDGSTEKIKTIPLFLDQLLEDGAHFKSEKLPSVIAFFNDKVLVGEGASNLKYKLKKGKNIWYSFKMEIGEDLGAKYYDSELIKISPFNIRNPKDAVRVFFMYLKILIERYCDEEGLSKNICYAISIPASFEANQRKELMEALETNGMIVARQSLIDEPNAAFISYVHDRQESERPLTINSNYNPKVLVFDFGGGTCDISILEIGKNANGLYSKNISISKFTKMGGDDVDRYITFRYLLPSFMEANNHKVEDFRTPERKFIATQLYKVAERLKILICKNLSVMMGDFIIPQVKDSTSPTSITMPIEIETSKGVLKQEKFSLTPAQMTSMMEDVFLSKSKLAKQYKGEEDYNNIYMPIESAIKKAKINRDELDYILLIGGSAQNPYIQESLKKYFNDSDMLVPQDLQVHVSKGAAIHSLLMNGMNKCLIQPITSEPIFVITKDTTPKVLAPAGTQIPSDTIIIDDLVTSKDKQDIVELPICVGSKNKILYILKIMNDGGFPINSQVKIALEINADKLLLAQAQCMGIMCRIEPQNPFANKELTTEERIVLVAERQANLETESNGGKPTLQSLRKLQEAYEKAGNNFRAAETMELIAELYPASVNFNSIGVLYDNAGDRNKAIEFYELALQQSPNNQHAVFNLGTSLKQKNPKLAGELLSKAYDLDPSDCPIMIEYAKILESKGNKEEADQLRQKAFDKYMNKWKANTLRDFEYSWFSNLADYLGKSSMAKDIGSSRPRLEGEKYYEDDNLTRTKIFEIEKQ